MNPDVKRRLKHCACILAALHPSPCSQMVTGSFISLSLSLCPSKHKKLEFFSLLYNLRKCLICLKKMCFLQFSKVGLKNVIPCVLQLRLSSWIKNTWAGQGVPWCLNPFSFLSMFLLHDFLNTHQSLFPAWLHISNSVYLSPKDCYWWVVLRENLLACIRIL